MRVISRKKIREAVEQHPEWSASLSAWYAVAKKAKWRHFLDIRQTWNSADQVGECVVFDVGGNHCRLISWINYKGHKIFIRWILSHVEYDKGRWKDDCDC